MKIVVIGYGRVGFRTVAALLERGHQITIIDKDAGRLGRATHLEGVELVQGNGIDVDVQREAGIGEADILLAVNRAYFNVLRAQAVLRVAEQTVAARQLVVDQVSALAESKLKSQLDVSFANVNLSDARLLLASAQNDIH